MFRFVCHEEDVLRAGMSVRRKTKFRPCIDLHDGKVKQVVGGSFGRSEGPLENHVDERPARFFAELYREDGLGGGHVIQLGPGNGAAAREALAAWPGGLQIGGGVREENAAAWLAAGASHVIVTSFLFSEGRFRPERLAALVREVGSDRLVIDLSCRRTASGWTVAMDRWQTLTDLEVTPAVLDGLAADCDEFLIHAADVEGKCAGMDEELVAVLGAWGKKPMTYAGGARSLEDLRRVQELSGGAVDLTIGSALDLFGGDGVRYAECVAFNRGE